MTTRNGVLLGKLLDILLATLFLTMVFVAHASYQRFFMDSQERRWVPRQGDPGLCGEEGVLCKRRGGN